MVSPLVTASCLLAGNAETELKPITFSSLLLLLDFLLCRVPNHFDILENELPDADAIASNLLPPTEISLPYTDYFLKGRQ